MYRHSLFFTDVEVTREAESEVYDWVGEYLLDLYLSNDGESRNIEVRFFTQERLDERTVDILIKNTRPVTSSINCDDGS